MRSTLVVNDLQNVVAAHIHCAAEGINGPVGITLFTGPPVSENGVLIQGPLSGVDSGNGCGWANLADFVAAMASGDTYVNAHTVSNLPGEIRGQLR